MMKNFLKNVSPMETQDIKQQQKLTKGGFKMKPTRFFIVAIVLLGMVATASAATQAFTDITNQAFGNYNDANGNPLPQVESEIVTTTVSQVAGVTLGLDLANPVSSMDSTVYAVTLSNTGNYEDTFSLSATGSATGGSFDYYVYHDADGSATINAGDTEVTSTGLVAFEGDYDLLIKVVDVTLNGASAGDAHTVRLIATSAFAAATKDTVELVSTVQAATVTGVTEIVGPNNPAPGESITYESCFTNNGTEVGFNPVFTVTMPSNTTLNTGSVIISDHNSGNPITLDVSATTPGVGEDFHYNTSTRTLTLVLPANLGTSAPSNGVCITYSAVVDDPLAAGLPIDFPAGSPELTYENGGGDEYPPTNPTEDPGTFPSGGVEVAQTFGVLVEAGGVNAISGLRGDPSDTLMVDFSVTNQGNGLDNFTFSDTTDYITWVYYEDTDGDGVLSAAEKAAGAITETGDLTAGQVVDYIAIGTIPAGTADAATDTSLITATSVGDTAEYSNISVGTTCTAPVLTLVKSVSPTGNQPPGTELTYTIVVANSGTGVASVVVVTDAIPDNTTYVAESMTVDGSSDDDDNVVTSPETSDNAFKAASSVVFDFDTMDASGGATDEHTLTFKVTID